MKIIQEEHAAPVEAIGGAIRIGEEFSAFQETLKDWFYACALLGTLAFCGFYHALFGLLGFAWEVIKERHRHRRQAGLEEEPPCELLDLDEDGGDFEDFQYEHRPRRSDNEAQTEGHYESDFANDNDENVAAANVGTESMGGEEERNNSNGGLFATGSAHRSSVVVEIEDDDDEWEDLPRPADSLPASPTHPAMLIPGRRPDDVSEQSTQPPPPQVKREMTDEELSELIFTGGSLIDNVGMFALQSGPADSNTMPTNESRGSAGGSDSRQRHPFFFFFCR